MSKRIIRTQNAPAPIGAYSNAVKSCGLVYTSGQLPVDPATGELVTEFKAATRQSLENIKNILEEAGTNISEVIKVTVYLTDLGNFAAFNEVYNDYFTYEPPARTCVQVAALPKGALIEIDAIAEA
ncbi:RidA family protein [Clostridia bacterium]|nr:RidA family protein [Clostridia bacterium]